MTSDQIADKADKVNTTRVKNHNGETGETKGTAAEKHRPPCEFCGKPSKNVFFAAFVCDSELCINKARDARGGPAGHKKDPGKWLEQNK